MEQLENIPEDCEQLQYEMPEMDTTQESQPQFLQHQYENDEQLFDQVSLQQSESQLLDQEYGHENQQQVLYGEGFQEGIQEMQQSEQESQRNADQVDHQEAKLKLELDMKKRIENNVSNHIESCSAYAICECLGKEVQLMEEEYNETTQLTEYINKNVLEIQETFQMYEKNLANYVEMRLLLEKNSKITKTALATVATEGRDWLDKCTKLREKIQKTMDNIQLQSAKLSENLENKKECEKIRKEALLTILIQENASKNKLEEQQEISNFLQAEIERKVIAKEKITLVLDKKRYVDVDEVDQRLIEKKLNLEDLLNNKVDWNEKYNNLCENVSSARSELERVVGEFDLWKKALCEKNKEIATLEEIINEMQEELKTLNFNFNMESTSLQENSEKLAENVILLKGETEEEMREVISAQKELLQLQTDCTNAYELKTSLNTSLKEAEYSKTCLIFEQMKKEKSALQEQREELANQFEKIKKQRSEKEEDTNKTEQKLKSDLALIENDYLLKTEECSQRIAEQKKKIDYLKRSLVYLEDKKTGLKNQFEQTKETSRLEKVDVQTLKLDIQSKKKALQDLRLKISDLTHLSSAKKRPAPAFKPRDLPPELAEKKVQFNNVVDVKYLSSSEQSSQVASQDDIKKRLAKWIMKES